MRSHPGSFVLLIGVALAAACVVDHGATLPGGGSGANGAGAGAGAGAGGATDDAGSGDGTSGNGGVDAGAPASGDGGAGTCAIGMAGAAGLVPAATMAPGTSCIACHLVSNGGLLYIAGTVYTRAHEPDLCLGVTDVKVQITDANGVAHLLDVNTSGNFVDNDPAALYPSPWTVAVVRGAQSNPMIGTVTNGDCNSCHTAAGAQNAPGRILAP